MKYVITINGKTSKVEAETAEMAVRKEMSWYTINTIFIVKDENGNIHRFIRDKDRRNLIAVPD